MPSYLTAEGRKSFGMCGHADWRTDTHTHTSERQFHMFSYVSAPLIQAPASNYVSATSQLACSHDRHNVKMLQNGKLRHGLSRWRPYNVKWKSTALCKSLAPTQPRMKKLARTGPFTSVARTGNRKRMNFTSQTRDANISVAHLHSVPL
jgi:hypothetical protein